MNTPNTATKTTTIMIIIVVVVLLPLDSFESVILVGEDVARVDATINTHNNIIMKDNTSLWLFTCMYVAHK